jgi:hypothetical protein
VAPSKSAPAIAITGKTINRPNIRNAYKEAREAIARFSVPDILDAVDIRDNCKKIEVLF